MERTKDALVEQETLCRAIRELRGAYAYGTVHLGLTHEKLADETGIDSSTICKLIKGTRFAKGRNADRLRAWYERRRA